MIEGIALDASAVGTINAGGVFGPDRAVRGWGPLHAEIASSNAIAPAQGRRHTVLSIPGWPDRVQGTPKHKASPTPEDAAGGSGAVAPDAVSLSWLKVCTLAFGYVVSRCETHSVISRSRCQASAEVTQH
jgi:hypothetical protein